jgi:hypothetical protein
MEAYGEIEFDDRYLMLLRSPEMTKCKEEWFWETKAYDRYDTSYTVQWPLKENSNDVEPDWENYRVVEWKT